ncbi:hypothetical protein LINPERHAP2_LOCUS20751 [Linum perenne]
MAMQDDAIDNPRCPRISFTEAEINSFYKPWLKAIVVKILEKTFSFLTVKRRLESLWARVGKIQVSDMVNDFYLVRFSDDTDYQRAAFGEQWKIYDFYISVSCWSPAFNEEEPIRKILTWVRLPRLPIHYFNSLAITRIGNSIRKTVCLDLATEEGAHACYARVCVELDLTKPLLGKYIIDNRVLRIEYKSLENICFSCGFYGHKLDRCPKLEPPQANPVTPESPPTLTTQEGDSGE